MKLNVVPAKTGSLWVRQGIRAFWKQPLALSGLFFMFMASMSILSIVPVLGGFLALMLLPAASLGLMAATREVELGKFPMPFILAAGFTTGKDGKRNMLVLGVFYALGFIGVMGLSALVDGGDFAKLYLVGGSLEMDTLMKPEFQNAMWLSLMLYLPLSMVFWHAPALTHWHAVPVVKSMFFSTVACLTLVAGTVSLLYGQLGMVSLAQFALAGVGGWVCLRLIHGFALPFELALLAGALVAAVFGLLVGLPALRMRGLYLALLTLMVAAAVQVVVDVVGFPDGKGACRARSRGSASRGVPARPPSGDRRQRRLVENHRKYSLQN